MLQGYIAKKWGDKMFENDMAKIVKKHAFWGAIIMALPTFGLGLIAYCYILWHMYYALCQRCETELKVSTVIAGIVVNFIVATVVNFVLAYVPIIGWLGTGFIVYLQFYLSGKGYIETLRKLEL
ncbi:hypothetical protein [Phocaeicola barnesiae]|uniref:DUF4870 domain-containing protein n=1 Tax=Phocaeicola barnesiae TaxID=376804 RepID=A0AAW5MXN5_9BACT|nr:hypothetical protein [Phocaeicola barnesiae]MCR8873186.1 hypothetical protein [Phocaeicola barnesiae]